MNGSQYQYLNIYALVMHAFSVLISSRERTQTRTIDLPYFAATPMKAVVKPRRVLNWVTYYIFSGRNPAIQILGVQKKI